MRETHDCARRAFNLLVAQSTSELMIRAWLQTGRNRANLHYTSVFCHFMMASAFFASLLRRSALSLRASGERVSTFAAKPFAAVI